MTSGAKQALREATTWAATVLTALTLIYFYHDLRAFFDDGIAGSPVHTKDGRRPAVAAVAGGFDRVVRVGAKEGGHFLVEAAINDRPVSMMADTGATLVVLTFEDAERLGLSPRSLDYSGRARTANGTAKVAPVTLDRMRVGDIAVRNVAAAVAERGALSVNLLGMSFLGKLRRFDMQRDELLLVQ